MRLFLFAALLPYVIDIITCHSETSINKNEATLNMQGDSYDLRGDRNEDQKWKDYNEQGSNRETEVIRRAENGGTQHKIETAPYRMRTRFTRVMEVMRRTGNGDNQHKIGTVPYRMRTRFTGEHGLDEKKKAHAFIYYNRGLYRDTAESNTGEDNIRDSRYDTAKQSDMGSVDRRYREYNGEEQVGGGTVEGQSSYLVVPDEVTVYRPDGDQNELDSNARDTMKLKKTSQYKRHMIQSNEDITKTTSLREILAKRRMRKNKSQTSDGNVKKSHETKVVGEIHVFDKEKGIVDRSDNRRKDIASRYEEQYKGGFKIEDRMRDEKEIGDAGEASRNIRENLGKKAHHKVIKRRKDFLSNVANAEQKDKNDLDAQFQEIVDDNRAEDTYTNGIKSRREEVDHWNHHRRHQDKERRLLSARSYQYRAEDDDLESIVNARNLEKRKGAQNL